MVKPGYKQTEIGMIPEDWEEAIFGKKVSIFRGGSPRPIQNYLTDSDDGVNWIKIGDVTVNGKYVTKTEEKIRPEGVSRSREVHLGDFILSNSMSFGRPYIVKIDGCIHDGWLTIQNYTSAFTTDYLYYLLSSDMVYKQYLAMAAGSSVKNLNKDKVGSLIVVYPETPEQKRIAEALSDMDELISSLEKLIAKKKAIKQGATQELLTGKRRLPGFTGEWEDVALGDILDYEQPTNYIVKSTDYAINGTPVLTAGKSFVLGYTNESKGIYKFTPVILFDDFITVSRYVDFPFKVKSSAVKLLKTKRPEDNLKLVYELMQMVDFQVVDHQRHWISQYSHINIRIPKEEEQKAISSVLSNMDSEIQRLERKLEKTTQIKQGMMQQLLTGKIRLV